MKECTSCKNSFPEEHYYFGRKGTRRTECRRCLKNRELKWLYGITLDDYEKMLNDQEGVCMVCGAPEPKDKRLNIDHCHESGAVRGLLCWRCNVVLGKVSDSPTLLRKLAKYLEDSK